MLSWFVVGGFMIFGLFLYLHDKYYTPGVSQGVGIDVWIVGDLSALGFVMSFYLY
jgi:hypothetical protein